MHHQFTPPISNFILRVLRIRGRDEGAAFIIDKGISQNLITAMHLIDETADEIRIFQSHDWKRCGARLVAKDEAYDAAVLRLDAKFDRDHLPIACGLENALYGQNTFFMGYPYGYYGRNRIFGSDVLPTPFVKSAVISMIGFETHRHRVALDGMNNPGFSGGPFIWTDRNGHQRLGGIVTGMREEERMLQLPLGERNVDAFYSQNAGIILATSWKVYDELID